MSLTPITDDLGFIQQLPDEPNNTLTAAELKAKFDQAVLTIKDYINNTLLPELDAGIGLMSDISALDDTTLTNSADHIPVSSVVLAALAGATAARLSSSINLSLSGGASGSVETDFSGDTDLYVGSISPVFFSEPVPVGAGGTGADTAADARTNLGLADADILQKVYPVGSLYLTTSNNTPLETFGFGTWARVKDRFLLAAGDTYSNGDSGGEATHTLTEAEMPSHKHTLNDQVPVSYSGGGYTLTSGSILGIGVESTTNTGGGNAHNNMPPYLTVNVWQRMS